MFTKPEDVAQQLIALLAELPPPTLDDDWLIDLPSLSAAAATATPGKVDPGLKSILIGFGLITPDGSFVSATAYYFYRSLIAGLQDGTLGTVAWRDQRGSTGFSLLESLERSRLKREDHVIPLRQLAAVMSVIKKEQDGKALYLMQYDAKAEQYQPLGGKREHFDADDQAALLRELSEELNLPPLIINSDLDVQFIATATVDKVSVSLGVLTRYRHTFFHVMNAKFLADPARDLTGDGITIWLDDDAILAGRAPDGKAISRIYQENIGDVLDQLPSSLPEPSAAI